MIKVEKLSVVLTLKNVEACCTGDLKTALEKVFDGLEEEGEHSLVHIEEMAGMEIFAHPAMPIEEFMSSFVNQLGRLVSAWDEKMSGSKLLTKLGQPFATIRAGLGWIAGFMEGRLDSINDVAQMSIPMSLGDLVKAVPEEVMRQVAKRFGIAAETMSKEEILEAMKKVAGKPEAEA